MENGKFFLWTELTLGGARWNFIECPTRDSSREKYKPSGKRNEWKSQRVETVRIHSLGIMNFHGWFHGTLNTEMSRHEVLKNWHDGKNVWDPEITRMNEYHYQVLWLSSSFGGFFWTKELDGPTKLLPSMNPEQWILCLLAIISLSINAVMHALMLWACYAFKFWLVFINILYFVDVYWHILEMIIIYMLRNNQNYVLDEFPGWWLHTQNVSIKPLHHDTSSVKSSAKRRI